MEGRRSITAIIGFLITIFAVNVTALCFNTICIDPGHGGDDPGTEGPQDKIDEKEVNLIVAQALRDTINTVEGGFFIVGMTRSSDVKPTLRARADTANIGRGGLGYDYFVSIHHNSANTNPCYVQGTEAWHSTNDSVPHGTLVPDSLDLSRKIDSVMAYKIYLRLVANWDLPGGDPYVARGLQNSDSLTVLVFNKRISVLTEASFICNEDEEDLFAETSHNHQKSEAGAIYRGFKSYCDNAGIAQISNQYVNGNGGSLEIDYIPLTSPVDRTWAMFEQHNLYVEDYFYLEGYWYYFHHWSHLLSDGTYLGPDYFGNDWNITVPAESNFHIYRAHFSGGPYWAEIELLPAPAQYAVGDTVMFLWSGSMGVDSSTVVSLYLDRHNGSTGYPELRLSSF